MKEQGSRREHERLPAGTDIKPPRKVTDRSRIPRRPCVIHPGVDCSGRRQLSDAKVICSGCAPHGCKISGLSADGRSAVLQDIAARKPVFAVIAAMLLRT